MRNEKNENNIKYVNKSNLMTQGFNRIDSITSFRLLNYALYLVSKKFDIRKYEDIDLSNTNTWSLLDWSDFTTVFNIHDYYSVLNIHDGGCQRREIEKSFNNLFDIQVSFCTYNSSTELEMEYFHCFYKYKSRINKLNKTDGEFSFCFNPYVLQKILNHKNKYTHTELCMIGGFSSLFSCLLYDYLKSFYNLKGKSYINIENGKNIYLGNDTWVTDVITIQQLRKLLNIKPLAYTRNSDFIKYAVDDQIRHIEEVSFNCKNPLKIEVEKIKKGKKIDAVRFICREVGSNLITKNDTIDEKIEKNEMNNEEKEMEYLKQKYKHNWNVIVETVYKLECQKNKLFENNPDYKNSKMFEPLVLDYIKNVLEKIKVF